jgi:hypothetical protein
MLHTPGEMPQVSKQYFRVPLNQEVLVAIKPQMMTTSKGLRHYSPNRSLENLIFESSKKLSGVPKFQTAMLFQQRKRLALLQSVYSKKLRTGVLSEFHFTAMWLRKVQHA